MYNRTMSVCPNISYDVMIRASAVDIINIRYYSKKYIIFLGTPMWVGPVVEHDVMATNSEVGKFI